MNARAATPARFLELAGWREPQDVLPHFAQDPMPALLMSGQCAGAPLSIQRWSLLCSGPFERVVWQEGDSGDPFRQVNDAVSRYTCVPAGEIPFAGGAVGFFSYDAGRSIERVPMPHRSDGKDEPPLLPTALFGLYSWAVVWDHSNRTWGIVTTGLPEQGDAACEKASADANRLRARLLAQDVRAVPTPMPRGTGFAPILSSSHSPSGYAGMVAEARRLIAEGEVYQVNLSQRLLLPAVEEPSTLFAAIARHSPSPFAAYIGAGPVTILSASPERLVLFRDGVATCRPIKGTRPRGETEAQDSRLSAELAASPKDRAENIMIVDLVRNDLGRVSVTGSVRPTELLSLESYASVHHLVSTISGTLDSAVGRADLLRALFPPGSMTGAPKRRAMQVIDELESVPRGLYAGSIGYLSFSGDMDMSVVIRTVLVSSGRAWLHVGGGVVADSDPAAEYKESLDKAASVRRALAMSQPGDGSAM